MTRGDIPLGMGGFASRTERRAAWRQQLIDEICRLHVHIDAVVYDRCSADLDELYSCCYDLHLHWADTSCRTVTSTPCCTSCPRCSSSAGSRDLPCDYRTPHNRCARTHLFPPKTRGHAMPKSRTTIVCHHWWRRRFISSDDGIRYCLACRLDLALVNTRTVAAVAATAAVCRWAHRRLRNRAK